MDREMRDWLKSLSQPVDMTRKNTVLSDDAAEYLARIATDGTLRLALDELGASDHDLAG